MAKMRQITNDKEGYRYWFRGTWDDPLIEIFTSDGAPLGCYQSFTVLPPEVRNYYFKIFAEEYADEKA